MRARRPRRPCPLDTGRAAIDQALATLAPAPVPALQISFFGGEPLMAWTRLVDLAEYARAAAERAGAALSFQVTTNGTLLNAQRLDTLERLGFHLALSLDGVPAAHDATRPMAGGRPSAWRVWEALDPALERFPSLTVISVLDPANVAFLGESVEALVARGARRLVLNPNWTARWTEAALDSWRTGYERAAERYLASYRAARPFELNVFDDKIVLHLLGPSPRLHGCGFGQEDVAVAPSGRLYPCARLVGEDRDHSMSIGDARTASRAGRPPPPARKADLPLALPRLRPALALRLALRVREPRGHLRSAPAGRGALLAREDVDPHRRSRGQHALRRAGPCLRPQVLRRALAAGGTLMPIVPVQDYDGARYPTLDEAAAERRAFLRQVGLSAIAAALGPAAIGCRAEGSGGVRRRQPRCRSAARPHPRPP